MKSTRQDVESETESPAAQAYANETSDSWTSPS
jgi:hypothetical protein